MCTGRLSASVKLSLILFLLGVWSVSAPPATAQDETLTGWFSFIVADYPTESGLASEITYALTEDSGERYELLIDIELMQPLGGPMALNRKRVTVGGEWEEVGPDETEKFWVYSIDLAPSPSTVSPEGIFAPDLFPDEPPPPRSALPAAAANSQVRGSQAWVTILCRFADATDVTPYPVSHFEKLMGSAYPAMGHYWKEVSYGNINLTGSVVVGWYNLPRPRSYYVSLNEDGVESFELPNRAVEDCTDAADADVFFPDFDGIILVFNQSDARSAFSRGGSERLTLDGQTRFYGVTWIHPSHVEDHYPYAVAHEMGHGFGLLHSSGPYGQDDPPFSPTTYDSDWDVMSGVGSFMSHDPEYGYLGVHTTAYHKDFLGWIPPDRKYVAPPNSTQTITLERLAQPGAEGYLMAQIPIGRSPTDFYTVEARLFAGYDDGIPDEAIVIHKVDTTREDRLAQVVDVDNNGDPNDAGAMWTVGEIFTDAENDIQVSIDAAYATSYRVTINTNPDTFSTCIDFLTSSSHIFGPGEDGASIQVTAASDCNWSATSHAEWLHITSGGTGSGSDSVRYTVAANPSPAVRTGRLTIDGWTFTVIQSGTNDRLFTDNMESGTGDWWTDSSWALTSTSSRSGAYAWTDSPSGPYQNDRNVSALSPVINLTSVPTATLTFWHRYAFASGDRGYVQVARRGERNGQEGWWYDGVPLRTFSGNQPSWQQVSLDLTPFVGEPIRIGFQFVSDASETAAGWTIDDVAVFSTDFVSPVTLENPRSASFQSGIGVISGWACNAQAIVIELNGRPLQAAYGTVREDTRSVCGDTDNGFSLLWNWNNLGAGLHTVRALLDGQEFANTTVQVTIFGEQFLRGASGTFDLPDFPASGETTVVRWEEALQNFIITDGQPDTGGGHSRVAGVNAILENPSLGSAQSGVGVISGWACEAEEIVIELGGTPLQAAYGTVREDTRSVCGDADNGFSLLWNWNNLGAGTHTVRALIDGVEFANTTVRVTTFGEEPFPLGLNGTFPIPDFPSPGENKRLQWEESLQNFVIIP